VHLNPQIAIRLVTGHSDASELALARELVPAALQHDDRLLEKMLRAYVAEDRRSSPSTTAPWYHEKASDDPWNMASSGSISA
jgi:hypothetical protein